MHVCNFSNEADNIYFLDDNNNDTIIITEFVLQLYNTQRYNCYYILNSLAMSIETSTMEGNRTACNHLLKH